MAPPSQNLKSVHEFLGRLKIPDAKIRKIKAMNVMERTKTPIPAKMSKKKLTDKDYHHTLLLELVRESGHKNYLIVFIRPKSDYDEKGDGKPYIMNGTILGEDTWSTDEDDDVTLYGPRQQYDDNTGDSTDDNADDNDGEEADEDVEEEADEAIDEDVDQLDDEDTDDADALAAEESDDQFPDGHYDSTSEDLAYFTADSDD